MTRKLIVEAIGTFFLVLTVGLVVLGGGAGALAPIAIGSVLMVMVYAGGHISGAHYNPAVTLGVRLAGRMPSAEMAGYLVVQLLAGAAGALVVLVLLPDGTEAIPAELDMVPAILAEFLFTFALVYVIMGVALARGTKGNSHYGLAIGFTVAGGAFAVGGISGAIFNPAVGLGLLVLGAADAGTILILMPVQIGAGLVASLVFTSLDLGDDKATTATAAEQAGLRPVAEP